MLDVAINKYKIKLMNTKEKINEIKTMGIDVSIYEKGIKELEEEITDLVNNSNNKINNDELEKLLYEKINELDNINLDLTNKFNIYYKIYNDCKVYDKEIEKINLDNASDIMFVIDSFTNFVINNLTLGFDEESNNLIENAYKLIYKAIKYELFYCKKHEVFNCIFNNEIGSFFISRLIKKDLEQIEDDEKIENIINQIGQNGLGNEKYINKELIIEITKILNPEIVEEIKEKIENINNRYKRSIIKVNEYQDDYEHSKNALMNLQKDRRKVIRRKIKKVGLITLFASAIIIGEIKLFSNSKEKGTKTVYRTIIEQYDDSKEESSSYTKDTDYIEKNPEEEYITIEKTTPWEKYENIYERYIYTYKVIEEKNYENLKDYININPECLSLIDKNHLVSESYDKESSKEDSYIVTKYIQDLNDYKVTLDEKWILGPLFTNLLLTVCGVLLIPWYVEFSYSKKRKNQIIKDNNTINRYNETKQELIEIKEKLKESIDIFEEIRKEYEERYVGLYANKDFERKIEKEESKILLLEDKNKK